MDASLAYIKMLEELDRDFERIKWAVKNHKRRMAYKKKKVKNAPRIIK